MNDEELRLLIRAAVQRHVGAAAAPAASQPELRRAAVSSPVSFSFAQYQIERADGDTMCIIEPAVQCNHCGFCKCHGH